MILTVALSPSIEKNISLDELNIGEDNHITYHDFIIGDSAVYSAYMIKLLQGEPYLIGFAGGISGRYIKYFTDRNKIKSDLLWKEQESRSVTTILDQTGQTTRLINHGFSYDEQDVKNFKLKFNSHIKDMYGVIINNHVDNPYTREMLDASLKFAAKNQLKTIIALSGEELRHALHYKPYALVMTKPDLKMLNIYYEDEIAQVKALHASLINDKIHMLFYQHEGQLYAVTKNKIAKVIFEKQDAKDIRMKDMLTGVLGVCVSRKYEMEKTLRLMGAVIDVADFSQYPQVCTRKEVMTQRSKISLIELYNQRNGYIVS
jgi:1-phosphofructokinase